MFEKTLRDQVEGMIRTQFPGKNSEKILNDIQRIFQPSNMHLLSVTTLDSNKNMSDTDRAILSALLKAKKNDYSSMLKLCLIWNREDIARDYIFRDNAKEKVCFFNFFFE